MKDVYVLHDKLTGRIVLIADDLERCNMELSKFSANQQAFMAIENHELLEDGD